MSKDWKPATATGTPHPLLEVCQALDALEVHIPLGLILLPGKVGARLWGFFRECPSPAHEWP